MKKIKTCFVIMDYSVASKYNLEMAKRLFNKVYAVSLFSKRSDIDVEQFVFRRSGKEDKFFKEVGEFIKKIAEEKDIINYIVFLPFSYNQKERFLEVNKMFSSMGIRNEAPSKGLSDYRLVRIVEGY